MDWPIVAWFSNGRATQGLIRERYNQTGNNDEPVAYFLKSTAGLITGAALIMVAIFSGFAAGDIIQRRPSSASLWP